MSDDWPPYLPHSKEHFRAVGVIAAVFNMLEHRLFGLLLLYQGTDSLTTYLFQKLKDNTTRVDILKRAVDLRAETDEIRDAVLHFCRGFSACADNRNIVMHSMAFKGPNALVPSLALTKMGKALDWNRFLADLPTLRRIADETDVFAQYGHGIFNHVVVTYRQKDFSGPHPLPAGGPLPDRPPLPTVLSPQPDQAPLA